MLTNDDLIDKVEGRSAAYFGEGRRSAEVLGAMRRVDRRLFLPQVPAAESYEDQAVPIGRGQTCSEPSMVAFMLDMLELRKGHRLLEIGAGSGYAAAVASLLCGDAGAVFACEVVESLAASMAEHLRNWSEDRKARGDRTAAAKIKIIQADGSAGFPDLAPFDRILLSAGVVRERIGRTFLEGTLLAQLAEGGIMIYPETVGALYRIRKTGTVLRRDEWLGVAFVPLRGRNA